MWPYEGWPKNSGYLSLGRHCVSGLLHFFKESFHFLPTPPDSFQNTSNLHRPIVELEECEPVAFPGFGSPSPSPSTKIERPGSLKTGLLTKEREMKPNTGSSAKPGPRFAAIDRAGGRSPVASEWARDSQGKPPKKRHHMEDRKRHGFLAIVFGCLFFWLRAIGNLLFLVNVCVWLKFLYSNIAIQHCFRSCWAYVRWIILPFHRISPQHHFEPQMQWSSDLLFLFRQFCHSYFQHSRSWLFGCSLPDVRSQGIRRSAFEPKDAPQDQARRARLGLWDRSHWDRRHWTTMEKSCCENNEFYYVLLFVTTWCFEILMCMIFLLLIYCWNYHCYYYLWHFVRSMCEGDTPPSNSDHHMFICLYGMFCRWWSLYGTFTNTFSGILGLSGANVLLRYGHGRLVSAKVF